MSKNLLERMKESPVVLDGAMGTMIYERGFFLNVCYDELNLTKPDLIQGIHQEYADAGADVLETNTFGANRVKLARYGLTNSVAEINKAGVRLARAVAGDDLSVAASVGSILTSDRVLTSEREQELVEAYAEQIEALNEEGVDAIMLETFSDIKELSLAAAVARQGAAPVFASFTVNALGETALGTTIEQAVKTLDADPNIDGIGMNCGIGPAKLYDCLERAVDLTKKPFFVLPNAGAPREVEGRMLYLNNPEYFTEYAKKFIELGARGVGGCCGTTPEHIQMAARSVKNLSAVKKHVEIKSVDVEEMDVEPTPPRSKSRFASLLYGGRRVSSVELLPPKSADMSVMLERARACYLKGVDAINLPDGPRASSRISPMIAAIAMRNQIGIEPVLHYCCRDRNLIGMQSDLLGAFAAGIANFLIITGDPPKLGEYPNATGVFDVDAIGLTQVTTNLNHGRDLGGNPIKPPTSIFIGVGANPCAVELERELERYNLKIQAGAEYAITQPVFDPEALFHFLDRASKFEKQIPVVAGVWPLTSYKNAEFMKNEVPGVEVPDSILERMSKCKTKEDGVKAGIEISREICDRISGSVQGFQVSAPFGRVDIALDVLD